MVNENLLATYSLLSYIKDSRNRNDISIIEIFSPLVKEALYQIICSNNGKPLMGRDYTELKVKIENIFKICIPIPILESILPFIQKENDSLFQLNTDHSFIIKTGFYSNLSEDYNKKKNEIEKLKSNYKTYCKRHGVNFDFNELVSFIQDQKNRLFEQNDTIIEGQGYHVSKYVNIRLKKKDFFFDVMCSIYLGGIIESYLKFQINETITNTELIIDTNFYISLINLNTEEAYETCSQLFSIAETMGFHFKILETTIEQIRILLSSRVKRFKEKDLFAKIDVADILSACDRRGLSPSSLEAYKDNLLYDLSERGISVIYLQNIKQIVNQTKASRDLKVLTNLRNNEKSAFNDLLAQEYVEYKRTGKAISEFSDVNCWFLTNSYSFNKRESNLPIWKRKYINASDLLVLLWYANPSLNFENNKSLLAIASLSANVFMYRSEKYPSYKTILELQNKIANLQTSGLITQKSIANLCMRMSEGCIGKAEANKLITLPANDLIDFINEENKKDELFIAHEEEMNEAKEEAQKMAEDNLNLRVENRIKDNRIHSILYIIGVIFVYYLCLRMDSLKLEDNWISILIKFLYWIFTTIILAFVNHGYFLRGLFSFLNYKKVFNKLIDEERSKLL